MADNQDTGTTGNTGNGHRSVRGFAAMDPETQRRIARKGGEAVSHNREHMSAIGRKGAEARNERRSPPSSSSSGRSSSSDMRGVQR